MAPPHEYESLLKKDDDEGITAQIPLCTPSKFTIITLSILVALLVGALFCVMSLADYTPASISNRGKRLKTDLTDNYLFGLIADIHLDTNISSCSKYISSKDMYYDTLDTSYGVFGCDTTRPLANKAMESLSTDLERSSNWSTVLFLGDAVKHQPKDVWDSQYTKGVIKEVFDMFSVHFPHTSVIGTVGNNDLPGFYQMPNESWYKGQMEQYRAAALRGEGSEMAEDFEETFLRGGYFSVKLPDNIRVISINTVYFSVSVLQRVTQHKYATEQLKWFKLMMEGLGSDEKVIIIGHHPLGVSLYHIVTQGSAKEFWLPDSSEEFRKTCRNHSARVIGIFFGHVHGSYQNVDTDHSGFSQEIASFAISSVSPVYVGQPSYSIGRMNTSRSLVDLMTSHTWLDYFTRLNEEPEFLPTPPLASILGLKDLSTSQLREGLGRIIEETDALRTHVSLKRMIYQDRVVPDLWPHLHYCFSTNLSRTAFIRCLEQYGFDTKYFVLNS